MTVLQQCNRLHARCLVSDRPLLRRTWFGVGVVLIFGMVLFGSSGAVMAQAADDTAAGPSPSPSDAQAAEDDSAAPAEPEALATADGGRKRCRCKCRRLRLKDRLFSRCRRKCCGGESPAGADPYAWKDLFDGKTLTGWKAPEFGGEGKVSVKDGAIVMEMGASMTGITYTGEIPRDNFELTLEGMKVEGDDFFCTTTFPVGKDPCTLVVGGWAGTIVGLSNVDFYDASDNPTTTFHDLKKNQWYKIRIRVSTARIEAWLDDEQVVNQEREGHKFDIRMEVDLCKPLGVSTWDTTGAVRNVRIRKLPPDAVQPEPAEE